MPDSSYPWLNVLVTGASSGIGLAAVQCLLSEESARSVVAVSRRTPTSPALQRLVEVHGPRLRCVAVDLSDPAQIDALGQTVAQLAPRLDLVFHAAGVLHDDGMAPEKSLQHVDAIAMQRSFAVNAIAPLLLLRALLPRLRHDGATQFASLSARVGSISDNRLGGWYSYRAAKAAQNQLLKTAAIELHRSAPRVAVLMLHPGTVDTPLSAPFQRGVPAGKLFSPDHAVQHLLSLLATMGPDDSGRFVAWDGTDVAW